MHLLGRLLLLQKPLEKLEQQLLWVEEEVHNLEASSVPVCFI